MDSTRPIIRRYTLDSGYTVHTNSLEGFKEPGILGTHSVDVSQRVRSKFVTKFPPLPKIAFKVRYLHSLSCFTKENSAYSCISGNFR